MNGFEVLWAPHGAAAWGLAHTVRPGLLLTDWRMSGIAGPALCCMLRDDPVLTGVLIIRASSLALPPI
ncbi:hypothetical protein [Paraburkholderia nemoris]|uniref:hypothetical protein n=1 Tax=Paraburkholderia nemoris TaxID=2793076 RepID=UPI001B8B3426